MSATKAPPAKRPKVTPPRMCLTCTETGIPLVRPCRICDHDYCVECLQSMFIAATKDKSRMPPACCALIQIHTIIRHLTSSQVASYRKKFEEWISPVKTYCPLPTCSAFISERRAPSAVATAPSLSSILGEVVKTTSESSPARFFRGEIGIDQLPGYSMVVKCDIDMTKIQGKIDGYRSVHDLTQDMRLLIDNARQYNGPGHPVTKTAEELFDKYLQELSNVTSRLLEATAAPTNSSLFACPKCHTAICTGCKQVEHSGSRCDTSSTDHEVAMLATFGYKRCPRCKAGVKKMYGCSHIQCVCGAHWCYYCEKGLNECDGTCEERAIESEDENEDDYDSEGDPFDDLIPPGELPGHATGNVPATNEAVASAPNDNVANPPTGHRLAANGVVPPTFAPLMDNGLAEGRPAANQMVAVAPNEQVANLDAGGHRRWAGEGVYDFGDEPEEPVEQVWSCSHWFRGYKAAGKDGFNRGDLSRMECNRCFRRVAASNSTLLQPPAGQKRRKNTFLQKWLTQPESGSNPADAEELPEEAFECRRCRVVVCMACRDKYTAAQEMQ